MVSKIKFIFILGILVLLVPILGVPGSIKDIILFIIGGLLIITSIFLKKSAKIFRLRLKRLEGQQGIMVQ